MSFLNSIEKKSKKFESPFTHWELNEIKRISRYAQ